MSATKGLSPASEDRSVLLNESVPVCCSRADECGQLGFVVIAHDHPENVRRLVLSLLNQGAVVALHWDARNTLDLGEEVKRELSPSLSSRFVSARRVKVEWGLWTVVEATLCGLEALRSTGLSLGYVTLLSGHDYPLRPLEQLKRFIQANSGLEFIEAVDHEKERWVTDGLHDERWQYRHFVSWRKNPKLFDRLWHWQRTLGLKVSLPEGIKPHFGSQWWTLSWPVLLKILNLSQERVIQKFFRRTWVPDEMFFQTLVAKVVPEEKIAGYNLNFYHFDKKGVPLVLHLDHLQFLSQQPHFFARKISPRADRLRDELDSLMIARTGTDAPDVPMRKDLEKYEMVSALAHGIPNRRSIGRQYDCRWGDMEFNRRPYTVIIAQENVDLQPVWERFARDPLNICYGDIFNPFRIDYGRHASPHPLYPAETPLLRDLKKPNFLFDLIQRHPTKHLVFSLRVPSHTEIPEIVLYDPFCEVVFVRVNDSTFWTLDAPDEFCWRSGFNEMVIVDLYWTARKNGKQCSILLGKVIETGIDVTSTELNVS